eukprot:scaffold18384_cov20-Tisochrysis_lutea.AAC.3
MMQREGWCTGRQPGHTTACKTSISRNLGPSTSRAACNAWARLESRNRSCKRGCKDVKLCSLWDRFLHESAASRICTQAGRFDKYA